jgi:hypothetical protein
MLMMGLKNKEIYMLNLKSIFSAVLVFSLSATLQANAQIFRTDPPKKTVTGEGGGLQGGGGDAIVEPRINEIRLDILKWIAQGGSASLRLPLGISHDDYVNKMNSILAQNVVVIEATDSKVLVNGSEKTCKGYVSAQDQRPHILCNTARFVSALETMKSLGSLDPETAQYQLVHHEFAGLVGLEKNDGASSDYSISVQMAAHLENVTVKRLAVARSIELQNDQTFLIQKDAVQVQRVVNECARQVIDDLSTKIFDRASVFTRAVFMDGFYSKIKNGKAKATVRTKDSRGNYFGSLLDHPEATRLKSVDIEIFVNKLKYFKENPYISREQSQIHLVGIPLVSYFQQQSDANVVRDSLGNLVSNPNPIYRYVKIVESGLKNGEIYSGSIFSRQNGGSPVLLEKLTWDTAGYLKCIKDSLMGE